MSCNKKALTALLGSVFIAASAQVTANPTAQAMADTCAGCHGTDGQSAGPAIPNLAGMSETYFIDSMLGFQALPKDATHAEDARPASIMNRIAKGYTEEQIESMAAHFAAMPVYKANVPHDPAKAEAGAAVYENACVKCHDEAGSLPSDDAGILAGQWLPWLEYSIADFKSGHRYLPKKMARALEDHSDAEIESALHFFASQR
jgi:sulfide dehydrogenase cytochrome subunit